MFPRSAKGFQEDLKASFSKKDTQGVARAIESLRDLTGLTVKEFCSNVGISTASYQRMVAKTGVRHLPKKIVIDLISSIPTSESELQDKGQTWSLTDLYRRHRESREVWALKHEVPFRAGIKGPAREAMIELLEETEELVLNFVFFGPKNHNLIFSPECSHKSSQKKLVAQDFPAYFSFCAFKAFLKEREKREEAASKVSHRLKGWCVTSKQKAFDLGICAGPVGVVINLDEIQLSDLESIPFWQNRHEVLLEMPVALSNEDSISSDSSTTVWHPQPAKEKIKAISRLISSQSDFFSGKRDKIVPIMEEDFDLEKIALPSDFPGIF